MDQQGMSVVGIDLGTTYSCIARVDENGKPVVIPNMEGENTTPSVVLFEGDARVVGAEAKNTALTKPGQVVEMVKREMGKGDWRFPFEGGSYTPEEISSYILKKVVGDAEQGPGVGTIKDAVITCPAYFGLAEKEATTQAGRLAGLNVVSIISEPMAAAIAYGLVDGSDQVVLVYDLGGGTFDITMIEIKGNHFTEIATGGNHFLGGKQWDERIVNYLAEQWKSETGSSADPLEDMETVQSLFDQAERGKKSLSARPETNLSVTHDGQRASVKLTRDKFDEITGDLLEQTIQFTHRMLEQAAEKGYAKFDLIILVGGSTKMPQVKDRLAREFTVEASSFDPDQAVAKGAAVYAFKLAVDEEFRTRFEKTGAGQTDATRQKAIEEVAAERGVSPLLIKSVRDLKVQSVTSRSFGVVVWQRRADGTDVECVSNIIKLNSPLPVEGTATFGTFEANQKHADCKYVENVSSDDAVEVGICKEIGSAILDLPAGLPAGAPIDICFVLTQKGSLELTAKERSSNRAAPVTIEVASAMSEEEKAEATRRSSRLVIS